MNLLLRKRPVRRIVTAVVLAAAVIGGTAMAVGTANADDISSYEDNFDDNPASRWSVARTSQGGTAVFGNSHATIRAHQATGWTAISRTVRVPAVGKHDCLAGVRMRTMSTASVRVNVEVIDPATFNYIAIEEATVSGQEWLGYSADWRNGPIKDVLFRVSMLAANATRSVEVDFMLFACVHDNV